jgi:hypothetical protein
VDELPAHAASSVLALTGDAVPDPVNAPELLDVQVEQLARATLLVTPNRLRRRELRQATETETAKPPRSRRSGNLEPASDLGPAEPCGTQLLQLPDLSLTQPPGNPVRAGGPILESCCAFLAIAPQPAVSRSRAEALGLSRPLNRPPVHQNPFYEQGSTCGAASGILMKVHSALPSIFGLEHPKHGGSGLDGPLLSLNNVVSLYN